MASGPASFAEGLQMIASDAMRLATLPDADPTFCQKIAQIAVAKAREPHNAALQRGATPGGGAPGPGIGPQGMPGGPPGGSPANPSAPPLGAPTMGPGPSAGLSPQMSGQNGDEIRRMIAGQGGP